MYMLAIMHRVKNAFSINYLYNSLVAPLRFFSLAVVFPAIRAPAAIEHANN